MLNEEFKEPIPLADFELLAPIGEGGTGQVWRALHRSSHQEVAVKVLNRTAANNPTARASFRREVRAVARLSHPAVVLIYDHGLVDRAAERLSGGRLVEGCPYLAMELLSGGTLWSRQPGSWPELKGVLLQVLDALAHAHARDVIHRDIKLSNVLLGTADDVRPGLKVTDFGAAHELSPSTSLPDDQSLVGTAAYIPPEQLLGRWREYGPWTDLYSLGVMVWRLVTGNYPYSGATIYDVFEQHLKATLPELTPHYGVPIELEAWLNCMLAKEPTDRYRRAADAAWALEHLGPAEPTADESLPLDPEATETLSESFVLEPLSHLEVSTQVLEGGFSSAMDRTESGRCLVPIPPPFPPTWQRRELGSGPLTIGGLGLGLYGLRPIPVVGRSTERDAMWRALSEVVQRQGPRLVAVEGESGLGKTQLVDWIAQRAHELGAASILKVEHGPIPGALPPLQRMVESHCATQGLSREEVRERLRRILTRQGVSEDYEVDGILELLRPSTPGSQPSARDRYALLERFITRLSHHRPVVLVVDDAQWGLDSLSFLKQFLQETDSEAPRILVLLTARSPVQGAQTAERQLLEEVLALPCSQRLELGPLEPSEGLALAKSLLGLSRELGYEVMQRSGGNPLFAAQLVGDWVERGLLIPQKGGFRLLPGPLRKLPDTIHQLWMSSVNRVLSSFGEGARIALELAAALGRNVQEVEWQALCRLCNVAADPELLDALAGRALIEKRNGGWVFAHGLLQESIERSSEEASRLEDHHRACVKLLSERGAPPRRLGRHLLAAGEHEQALAPLLRAADDAMDRDDYAEATQLYDQYERAMKTAGLPDGDRRWSKVWAKRGRLLWRIGSIEDAEELILKARTLAAQDGWHDTHSRCLESLALITRHRGNLSEAIALAQQAVQEAKLSGRVRRLALARRSLGHMLVDRAQFEPARELIAAAKKDLERLGDIRGIIACDREFLGIARQTGDWEQARMIGELLRDVHEQRGSRWGLGLALESLGEVARYTGDLEEAEALYRRSCELLAGVSRASTLSRGSHINIAIVLLEQENYAQTQTFLLDPKHALLKHPNEFLRAIVHLLLATCDASDQRWESFERHLAKCLHLIERSKVVDIDIATILDRAASLAIAADEPRRAEQLLRLSAAQWHGLRREGQAREAEDLLRAVAVG